MQDDLLANVTSLTRKRPLSLTLWPTYEKLFHPSPYKSVENPGCPPVTEPAGLTILCADVMTLNSAGGIIVAFVLGSTPPFRYILTHGACPRPVSQIPRTPKEVTYQVFDTRNHPSRASHEVCEFVLQPMGYQPAKRRPCAGESTRVYSRIDGVG